MATNLNEYYKSIGQSLPSVQERAKLFESQGLGPSSKYIGSSSQNSLLLGKLGSSPTVNQPSITAPITSNFNQIGSQDLVQALVSKGYSQVDAENAARNDTSGSLRREYLGGTATTLPTQPKINLSDTYNQLVEASGISGLETNVNATKAKITQMEADAAAEKAKVNENPWIGEASRIGRIAKIDTKLAEATAPLQKDVANLTNQVTQKQTEVSNKLGLTTSQYNIDIASNQQNLANFNSLLSSGALANATPQDIATLAQQTGLASSFIQSAINQAKKAANPLSVGTYTDANNNLVAYTMDSQGNLVSSNTIGKTKATSTGTSATKTATANKADFEADANVGKTLQDLWRAYKDTYTNAEILKMYNSVNYYGKANETVQDMNKWS